MKRSVSVKGKKVQRLEVKDLITPDPLSLLVWYDQHRRIMPWRALAGIEPDPYRVWISEIMLQQTTVAAVVPYFHKFIMRWPTVRQLAKAPLNDVMRMWAGLGYYRRARMLHECARVVAKTYGGEFPSNEAELLKLPGFGSYTAAAVSAIAFDQRANVVDGNVERVMARIFAIREPLPQAKPALRAAALSLLPQARHGDYAQALMDLGATICTPRNPKCDLCPWRDACQAHTLGIQDELPRRARKQAKPVRRAMAFVLFDGQSKILLRQRPKTGLLGGMMEIPGSAWREGVMPSLAQARKEAPAAAKWRVLPGLVRHVFSHFELELAVAVGIAPKSAKGRWVAIDRLTDEALPSVMRKIIKYALPACIEG